jgi:hypothetical protein
VLPLQASQQAFAAGSDQDPDSRYEFGSGITMEIKPNQPVSGNFASFPIQTYGDWDEDEAWQYFQEETESGLVNS